MYMVEEYENASKSQYRDALEIIEEFEKEMSEMKGKCIDIGCGPGDVTKRLILPRLSSDAVLVGADISKPMIDRAKQKYQDEKRLSFLQLDIEAAVLPNEEIGQFSNALSFYCFHWCQNTWRAFENVYKLLRPGGKALIMFLAWNNGFDAYVKLHENPRYKPYMQDVDRYVPFFQRCKDSRAALRKMLEGIGFEILHCSKREKSFVYENMEILKNHTIAVNPFIPRIPDDLRQEFEDAIVREIASRKILFPNKTNNDQQEYSILDRYHILVAYIKKPIATC
ncbi:juvenile hormone acid methyltransferase isoform X1 [Osmia lignaria lignaria]|uniref:juvenile hormone acid methyltransferase isoform X1 n=1 Tax=Osmia lignaria lignaria TaxID=1437193 RepID=UPI0014792CA4|nr:juvenile hormone acid O-methyltransferase isoform X1 [Osmia lignaria]XP_034173703.1 juvenile hormone acid O-methyltransferase isoform X1 [Osmia lignaria]